ncbi:hypothetical protein GQ53DRAFT_824589 [Thozetella sp. PMI_491]|nr:hypothetical protein GQ53DRAFT_824589 [Thozetella sp. PMI_491]
MAPFVPIDYTYYRSRQQHGIARKISFFNANTKPTVYRHTWGFTVFRTFQRIGAQLRTAQDDEQPVRQSFPEEFWSRYRSDVIEDRQELDGADMETVLKYFQRWRSQIDDFQAGMESGHLRFRNCLIVDNNALESFKNLPETLPFLPETRFEKGQAYQEAKKAARSPTVLKAWVWALNEEHVEERRIYAGQPAYIGWLRVDIGHLNYYWDEVFATRRVYWGQPDRSGTFYYHLVVKTDELLYE